MYTPGEISTNCSARHSLRRSTHAGSMCVRAQPCPLSYPVPDPWSPFHGFSAACASRRALSFKSFRPPILPIEVERVSSTLYWLWPTTVGSKVSALSARGGIHCDASTLLNEGMSCIIRCAIIYDKFITTRQWCNTCLSVAPLLSVRCLRPRELKHGIEEIIVFVISTTKRPTPHMLFTASSRALEV